MRKDTDESLVESLRSAALSAIATFGDGARSPRTDSNPHTQELTPYDLARLFCGLAGDRDNVATNLDQLAVTIERTSPDPGEGIQGRRRAARASWIAYELDRLGARRQSKRFAEMASTDHF